MSGEKIVRAYIRKAQTSKWDELADIDEPKFETDLTESETNRTIEHIAEDAKPESISFMENLKRNWPVFTKTKKCNFDGAEIEFPCFDEEIVGGEFSKYSKYLSTERNPSQVYEELKNKIGAKSAAVWIEACLDNPLVATMMFGIYENNANSSFNRRHEDQRTGEIHSQVELISEDTPLSFSLNRLERRLAGIRNTKEERSDPEKVEKADTITRAMIEYHEIGHGIDFLVNHLKLPQRREISAQEIADAMDKAYKERVAQLECRRIIPQTLMNKLKEQNWSTRGDAERRILERRGLSEFASGDEIRAYNDRLYRETLNEQRADRYASEAVCVRHRYRYFAKNDKERQSNPEKKAMPIYGEYIFLGDDDFSKGLDFGLIQSGIVAGRRVTVKCNAPTSDYHINPDTHQVELNPDFDYDAHQKAQRGQETILSGKIKNNPHNGKFEIETEGGDACLFYGDFYRQHNDQGEIEIVNGLRRPAEIQYRICFEPETQGEIDAKSKLVYCGDTRINKASGIDSKRENYVLFVNDNTMFAAVLGVGGIASDYSIDENGMQLPRPTIMQICNGIPKVMIRGQVFEVAAGSEYDLQQLKEQIAQKRNKTN